MDDLLNLPHEEWIHRSNKYGGESTILLFVIESDIISVSYYGKLYSTTNYIEMAVLLKVLGAILTRAVESDFRKSNKSRMPKLFLYDFLTGRKHLLLWSV